LSSREPLSSEQKGLAKAKEEQMASPQRARARLDESDLTFDRPDVKGGPRQTASSNSQAISASSVNLLAGIWLICAPFVLTYSGTTSALWNDIVVGATIATIAAFRVFGAYRQTWLSWTNAILGCWLVIAPFVLSYSDVNNAVYNDIVLGLLVVTFAIWSASATRRRALRG
jgi:hypothetical protein